MAALTLTNVSKAFDRQAVIRGVDLEVPDGSLTVFVGPSGCGKSTLLRLVAGLEAVDAGSIHIGGRDVTDLPPAQRGVAMVFQSYALYPHMSVFQNMAFGLKLARRERGEITRRVREAARLLQIEDLLERRPRALSGGQRQRVAIGRAIVREPRGFLFDEPLSNLDAALRVQMRLELAALQRRLGTTTVYVTHDQVEAMTLGERIVVLREGRVEQVGSPLELYRRPANRFVAGFIGSPRMNFIEVRAVPGSAAVRLPDGERLELPGYGSLPEGPLTLGIRPEDVRPGGSLAGEVELVEHLGNEVHAHLRLPGGERLTLRRPPKRPPAAGDRLGVALPAERCHLFAADGRTLNPA